MKMPERAERESQEEKCPWKRASALFSINNATESGQLTEIFVNQARRMEG